MLRKKILHNYKDNLFLTAFLLHIFLKIIVLGQNQRPNLNSFCFCRFWFYFSIENTQQDQRIIFNLVGNFFNGHFKQKTLFSRWTNTNRNTLLARLISANLAIYSQMGSLQLWSQPQGVFNDCHQTLSFIILLVVSIKEASTDTDA